MQVAKHFEFESAHRLSDYEGKCERIHGHNYKGYVTIEGKVDKRGILVDFAILKEVLKGVSNLFDHKLIVKDTEENGRYTYEMPADWLVWVNYNPTAENLALDILNRLRSSKLIPAKIISVTLYETDDSFAIAT